MFGVFRPRKSECDKRSDIDRTRSIIEKIDAVDAFARDVQSLREHAEAVLDRRAAEIAA